MWRFLIRADFHKQALASVLAFAAPWLSYSSVFSAVSQASFIETRLGCDIIKLELYVFCVLSSGVETTLQPIHHQSMDLIDIFNTVRCSIVNLLEFVPQLVLPPSSPSKLFYWVWHGLDRISDGRMWPLNRPSMSSLWSRLPSIGRSEVWNHHDSSEVKS
mmetsp:Transcript_42868/g.63611  ORF Transcript_42868/g.63611 Transcript_42868/m.63611 type:complete len:160 (-) Transcript_42868:46-525(-)